MNPNDPTAQPTPEVTTDPGQPSPSDESNAAPVAAPQPTTDQPLDSAPVAEVSPQPAVQPSGVQSLNPTAVNPGKGLGIASLVTSLLGIGLVGLILGILGISKSKKAGMNNGLAIAGIVIGVLGMIAGLLIAVVAFNGIAELAAACQDALNGTVTLDNGTVVTCES